MKQIYLDIFYFFIFIAIACVFLVVAFLLKEAESKPIIIAEGITIDEKDLNALQDLPYQKYRICNIETKKCTIIDRDMEGLIN